MFQWRHVNNGDGSCILVFQKEVEKVVRIDLGPGYLEGSLQVIGKGNGKILTEVIEEYVKVWQSAYFIT